MKQKKIWLSRKAVTILTILLLIIGLVFLWIFIQSQSHLAKAEQEAIELINVDHRIKRVNDFQWFTLEESTFSIDFVDEKNQQRYAIIQQEGGDIEYFTPKDIISAKDAKAITASEKEVDYYLNARLGKLENVPVWEVIFRDKKDKINYFYINAKTGEWLQSIENI